VKIKLLQASDTKLFHIGFYVAKVDPGTMTEHISLWLIPPRSARDAATASVMQRPVRWQGGV
jgi:hypothetical protein